MKFSTIIPLYNAKNTIIETIKSVLRQTYQEPIEIIVVNDGSTDGCERLVENLIKENSTNRTIKLINQPNGGVSTARNRGIREADGKYIAFLDSDDCWHPQKLEIISNILATKEINMLGHTYTLEDNFEQLFSSKNIKEISFFSLLVRNFAVTPSVVVKRDMLELFDETMRHTEDHELWLRMALKKKVYFIDVPLVRLKRPPLSKGGLSSNRWAMRKGEMQMYINIVKAEKKLIFMLPFLVLFSLTKHIRSFLKDFFTKN